MKKQLKVRAGKLVFTAVAWMVITVVAHGVQPKRIIIDEAEDFAQGEVDSVVLKQPGLLQPGPRLDLAYDFENTLLWDAVELAGTGHLIIGTGPEGKVYQLSGKGKLKELTAFKETDVYAVALSPKGEVFVASSPDGKVFKWNGKGEFETWFEHGEKYVWDMRFDQQGKLYLATGQTGKLFRVDGKNQGEVVFDAEEPHLRSVVLDPEGGLIIGTTGSALIYHYQEGQEPVVLLDASRTDISAVAVSDTGIIYAAAVGKKQTSPQKTSTAITTGEDVLAAVRGLVSVNGSDESTAPATPAPQQVKKQPISSGKSTVCEIYRIDRKRFPRVIYQSEDEIHSLAWGHGRLIAGAGAGGRFFEIEDDGQQALLGQIQSKQVTTMLAAKQGFILLGSNWGKVVRMSLQENEAGSYTSKVIDSGLFAEWGRLKVYGEGKWSVRTRSGNTADPDKSWYPWQFVKGGKSVSPRARYFQFEINLDAGVVERVDFTYQPQNQEPVIKVVKVLEPNQGFISMQAPPAAPKIQTASQLMNTQSGSSASVVRYRPVTDAGLRTIAWDAADPNGDQLRYDLKIRREGGEWEMLASDIEDTVFSWDTRGWPDGVYYVEVQASDHIDNGGGEELTGTKTSEAWRIDHTSPEITLTKRSPQAIQIQVTDTGGVLEAVAVSMDGQSYRISIPEDGILDSESEVFSLERKPDSPLYIRAKDENGNVSGLHIPAEK